MAMNGMLSVNYPSVYRSFTSNFGFSTGLVSWDTLQNTIDGFRAKTGGNLTEDSVAYLQNTTLRWSASDFHKRSLYLIARDIVTSVNGTTSGSSNATAATPSKAVNFVHGIEGYVEELQVPKANTFMTVLLVFSIILAAITAGILLFKIFLEIWALFGTFPTRLTSFRQRYWWLLAKTVTNLILLLYGVWVLYCIYQFKIGDSWAAKVLAGVTLFLFTAVLVGFTWRIYHLAHKYEKSEGDTSALFDNKETWQKYSLFYAGYKKSYWWLFIPAIIYMFTKSCIIAGADGHGLAQSAGQLVVEFLFLILILILRPYSLKSGNWINVIIQVVRVISVVCVLVFVDELGVSDEGKTVIGYVLIIVQSVLTALLAILIAVNAIAGCVRMNPHRKRRKEAGKSPVKASSPHKPTNRDPRETPPVRRRANRPLRTQHHAHVPADQIRHRGNGHRAACLRRRRPVGDAAYHQQDTQRPLQHSQHTRHPRTRPQRECLRGCATDRVRRRPEGRESDSSGGQGRGDEQGR